MLVLTASKVVLTLGTDGAHGGNQGRGLGVRWWEREAT